MEENVMSMGGMPRRRMFIIDREYQWRYLSTWLIMTLAYVLIILVVMYIGLRITRETSNNPESYTALQLASMLKWNALFIILLTIFFGLVTILFSHRVTGPAYRLTKSMRRMLEGDYSFTVTLRKRDYLQDVAAGLNDVIERLREKEEKLKALDAEAERLREMVAAENVSAEIRLSVERITLGLDGVLVKSPLPEVQPIADAAGVGAVASASAGSGAASPAGSPGAEAH